MLPPFAAFEIELPDGWEPDEAPDCLGIFVAPGVTGFRVNLLVGADRVGATFALEDAAAATLEHCRAHFSEFRVEQEKVAEIAGQPAALRFQSFTVDGVEDRLLQLQVLLFAPPGERRQTKDLFHIDGTCLARDKDTYAPVFAAAAESFRFV
ncbi:MAG TPA: DcrB-related protein [Solirubrobacter sp.]|nr:DcrB-related protein [Solirubrobacter sp.]